MKHTHICVHLRRKVCLFCIVFNVPSNTHPIISGRPVPTCNRGYDNHFIMLFHCNFTPHAHLYDIPPCHIILTTGQPVFALNCQIEIFADSAGNRTRLSKTRSERSTTRLLRGHERKCWLKQLSHTVHSIIKTS